MADPFTELGLSRRPLFQMFGLPEDRGAASPLMQQAVQEDRIQQAAQMKLEQDFADLERRGQAEAAADEFVRQNPDAAMAGSSRFGDILRYQQTQQRGPSYSDAVLSRSLANRLKPAARERFYQYVNEGRGVNQAFDDAEADEEDMKARIELVEAGVPLEALSQFEGQRIDPLRAAALKASLKGGGKDPAIAALESNFDVLRKEYEDARSLGEVSPELEQEYRDTRNELLKRRRSIYSPTPSSEKPLVDAVAAGSMGAPAAFGSRLGATAAGGMGAPAAPAPAVVAPPPAGGFMETMRKAAKPEDVLRVDEQEIIAGVNDPSADENTFMMAIEDPNTSFEVKKRAAERLRQIADRPPKDPSLSLAEADARKSRLMQAANAAEKQVRMYPEMDKFRKAWTEEKSEIDKWINEYADSMGYDVDNLKVSLAKDEVSVADIDNPITRLDEFKQFVKDKYGDVLSRRAEKLEPFLKSEFRKELGMGAVPLSTFGSLALALLAPGKGQGHKTYGDVLDAYLEEVKKPVAAGATRANITTTPKIEIGQPRKVQ